MTSPQDNANDMSADPFFASIPDPHWNACVGRQGNELNYLDGYIEAALELVSSVIEKQMMSSRDTLAMPILYNGRHGLELVLKFTINQLFDMGAIPARHHPDHDISSHWSLLHNSCIGDRKTRELIKQLEPYVVSLSKIDGDGQELRFAQNRSGDRSLDQLSVVNLKLIRSNLQEMSAIIAQIKYRILELRDEHTIASYTRECSRRDLEHIATMLGERSKWREEQFDEIKSKVMTQYELSGRKFSQALTKIQQCPPLAAIVGLERDLTYLSDEKVIIVIERWKSAQPRRSRTGNQLGIDYFSSDRKEMFDLMKKTREVHRSIANSLTMEEFAELEVLFYIGRNKEFGEVYDDYLKDTVEKYKKHVQFDGEIDHLLSKTNLQDCLADGCTAVGRPSLASKLRGV